jgi:pyruvate formate lyase activating enzyme
MEKKCAECNKKFDYITEILPFCKKCIIEKFDKLKPVLDKIHINSRKKFELEFPIYKKGTKCVLCARECYIEENKRGFCGLREKRKGKLLNYSKTEGFFKFYFDPLPTNCVADFVCSGHNAYGKYNLALFYETCSLNCLFCQNYHFRFTKPWKQKASSYKEVIKNFNNSIHCICFFGGDPTTQAVNSLKIAEEALKREIVVCYESNGMWNKKILERILKIVKKSGGILKFDIKAYSPEIYYALTGYGGKKVFENFEFAFNFLGKDAPKHLCVSTLLVPGYIDKEEISKIADFISSLDKNIPYSLLAFSPQYEMEDMRFNNRKEVEELYLITKKKGLKRVKIGNTFLIF